jgi:hypothetical protein
MPFKERWQSERESWKKLWRYVIKPSILLIIPCAFTITIFELTNKQDFQVFPIIVGVIGTNVIWLRGFHKGGFLARETKWYVWNRIMYGTLWLALLYGATLIAMLLMSVLQNK